MIITLIIGKNSNLSQHLSKKIDNSILISSRDLLLNTEVLKPFLKQKINIIFNNFQPATKLNKLDNATDYIQNAITTTAVILQYFKSAQINKIIYTSSSSIYGNNALCHEYDLPAPLNLHACLKLSNELLVSKYCQDNKIDYTITRLFNMYGGNDIFSIISKIIDSVQHKTTITLINQGSATRDFIHIDDVVNTYYLLLDISHTPIINIGTGQGKNVKEIVAYLTNKGHSIATKDINLVELKQSIANNDKLLSIHPEIVFKKIEDYLDSVLVK